MAWHHVVILSCNAGDVAIFSAAGLTPVQRLRGGHMVFVTAVAFAGKGLTLSSTTHYFK